METVLTADSLKFNYSGRDILENFNLTINQGKMISIVGPNGSGKSTVLRLLTRLLQPKQGIVYLDGADIAKLNNKKVAQKLAMLPQVQDHFLDMTVRDLVKQGRYPHLKWYEECRNEHETYVDWAISITDLTMLQHRSIYTLSGGERQRAWIAMAIAQMPQTLLLDEPTTYLDIAHQLEIMELLKYLNQKKHITIVMVLHDLNQASLYSDRLIAMKDGNVIRQGTPHDIFEPQFFKEVFAIEAKVHHDQDKPFFTPIGLASSKRLDFPESTV